MKTNFSGRFQPLNQNFYYFCSKEPISLRIDMPLPINIEDLLSKNRVESHRIEFKAGWNPDKIYHSICAFANDIDNIGGGYILVGVEEENGVAKRPVKGLPMESVDKIQKEMIGYDQKIEPYYACKVSTEQIDGKVILVIWVPAGLNRPYCVTESVIAKKSVPKWYVRSKSSSIEAKGEVLDELRELANRVPFDERGNEQIHLDDISEIRVYEYLKRVNSKLAQDFKKKSLMEILEAMDLLDGPTEHRLIKNVAAMMFSDNPAKFFPVTQVDIVSFPEGSIQNPDVMEEVPKIVGPVPKMIEDTLSYLRTNVIKQRITKSSDKEQSDKAFNYPYQALEEAVVNALYHRDYQEREPVEITIEPTHIDILSYAGPDRSISNEAIKEARKLKARRYRNRRLGDFLKELDLTEGRATGVPTIQKTLRENGSESAVIDTDADRSYFLITIPCRKDMVMKVALDELKDLKILQVLNADFGTLVDSVLQVLDADKQIDKAKIGRLVKQVLQVCDKSWSEHAKGPVVRRMFLVLVKLMYTMSGTESIPLSYILGKFDIKSRYEFKTFIANPLFQEGLIELTVPDKPTSSKQCYRLTQKGKELLN
jgi:ATP-dependent DNA helicase RecG